MDRSRRTAGIKRMGWVNNFAYAPGSINNGATDTSQTANIPEVGLTSATVVHVTLQTPTAGFIVDGYVSAQGVITIRTTNVSGSTGTPTASVATVMAIQVV